MSLTQKVYLMKQLWEILKQNKTSLVSLAWHEEVLANRRDCYKRSGIHKKHFGHYKMLTKRFPFAIYYDIEREKVVVHAVLDTRLDSNAIEVRFSKVSE